MPRYLEVIGAVSETATKILALRSGGRRHEVEVTTNGGQTASVSWTARDKLVTLNMPSLPPDAVLTRAEADRMVAFVGHECCHVLHSDRAAWDLACAAGARVRDWTNALEDIRIEQKEIKAGAFPALGSLLGTMVNHLHYEAVVESGKTGRMIGARVADAPYVSCILGRVANGYAVPAAAGLEAGLSPEATAIVRQALAGVRKCGSTEDVRQLAEQLVAAEAALPQPPRQPRPQPGEDKGKGGQEGSEGGQEGQGGQEGSEGGQEGGQEGSEGGQEGSEGGQEGGQKGSEGEGKGKGEGEGEDEGEGEGEDVASQGHGGGGGIATDADLAKTIAEIAKRAGMAEGELEFPGSNAHKLSTVRNRLETVNINAPAGSPGEKLAAAELGRRLPANSVLHGQIGRLLVSEEVLRRTHHESSGRLDRRALSRMRAGARDVFSQRDDTPGIDTALLILVDGSSSMLHGRRHGGPSRIELAQTATWHIAKAAEAANAKLAIASFHTPQLTAAEMNNGACGALVRIVKPWHVPVSAYAISQICPTSSTPLSAAILACSQILAGVSATRRILMVLTDGDCDLGREAVTKACALAEDDGVETVGIGLNAAGIAAAFPPRYSVNVEDLDQLAATGLGVLTNMLEEANPRGAD